MNSLRVLLYSHVHLACVPLFHLTTFLLRFFKFFGLRVFIHITLSFVFCKSFYLKFNSWFRASLIISAWCSNIGPPVGNVESWHNLKLYSIQFINCIKKSHTEYSTRRKNYGIIQRNFGIQNELKKGTDRNVNVMMCIDPHWMNVSIRTHCCVDHILVILSAPLQKSSLICKIPLLAGGMRIDWSKVYISKCFNNSDECVP